MSIGILAKILLGNKNQKSPTPRVKKVGKINDKSVKFFPNPSLRDQVKSTSVRKDKEPILINLYDSSNS